MDFNSYIKIEVSCCKWWHLYFGLPLMCVIFNAPNHLIQLSYPHIQILYWLYCLLEQTIVWIELHVQIFVILLPVCFPQFLPRYTPDMLTLFTGLLPFCLFHIKCYLHKFKVFTILEIELYCMMWLFSTTCSESNHNAQS